MKVLRKLVWAAALIAAVEALVSFGLGHPAAAARAPLACRALLRGIYLDGARNIIQFEPDCARYDAGLSYTLKPGEFTFENAEFRTDYHVNSLGIRSTEEELKAPELIVLGDSRAMGWGVEQDELYSEILGQRTGLKTLNAAVSSYGTVREMKLLDRLDLSNARTLVLHYVENDYDENAHYFRNDNFLKIMDREKYQTVQRKYLSGKRYYFGKYTLFLLWRLGAEAQRGILQLMSVDPHRSDALYFLNALKNARKAPLDGLNLIVMGDGGFIKRLRRQIQGGDYPAFIEKMTLVSDDVEKSGFFTIDNHMNRRGHELLAERLLPKITG